MNEAIRYIIQFLLGDCGSPEIADLVGYTHSEGSFSKYKVIIVPSGFFTSNAFGTKASRPTPPFCLYSTIPILFGSNEEQWNNNTGIIHADIIASAFYLLSRYEEIILPMARDEHGRFLSKDSLLHTLGWVDRPLVDYYGKLLRHWLRQAGVNIPHHKPTIHHYYLTHDVDEPYYCHSWRNIIRRTLHQQSLKDSLRMRFNPIEKDTYFTYPWLQQTNTQLIKAKGKTNVTTLYFFKAGGKAPQDKPYYSLKQTALKKIIRTCKEDAQIGLHTSYSAGLNPFLIAQEKELLQHKIGQRITTNRHHFLASREPKDFLKLQEAGIRDDFTMGFADHAGFRLGTAHSVHFISPYDGQVHPLLLHPLTLMDATLSDPNYMNLGIDEATEVCLNIAKETAKAGGELVTLWHNSSVAKQPISMHHYQRSLYASFIHKLTTL